MNKLNNPPTTEVKPGPEWLDTVRKQVGSLRFGAVEIVVHESRVVQIETTERVRFDKPRSADDERVD